MNKVDVNCKGFVFSVGKESKAHLPLDNVSGLSASLEIIPRIDYALAVFANAGVNQVMIGASAEDVAELHLLLTDGQGFGTEISYLMLHPDSSIEQALSMAHRFIANRDVLLATPGVCCTNFKLSSTNRHAGYITSFRMKSGAKGMDGTRPDLLLIGNRALLRLRRQLTPSGKGSKEIDQLRRSCMTRFKYQEIDLSDQCAFANLRKGAVIDHSVLSEETLNKLLSAEL